MVSALFLHSGLYSDASTRGEDGQAFLPRGAKLWSEEDYGVLEEGTSGIFYPALWPADQAAFLGCGVHG